MPARFLYLHGFASSPSSHKAREFRARLGALGVDLLVPALEEGDFRSLTITRMLALVHRTLGARAGPVAIIGSSLGGYLAALTAVRRADVAALVLMAPAFDFAVRWASRLGKDGVRRWRESGELMVMHHAEGRERALGPAIIDDALHYPAFPAVRVPTLIVHGRRDETVPAAASLEFARHRPNVTVELVDDEHALTERFEEVWAHARRALAPLLP